MNPHPTTTNPPVHAALAIEWQGESLRLRSDRAIAWPAKEIVFIADPHFGKASSFRAAGVPVPSGTTRADLDRLSRVITEESARALIVLGDFFHARAGLTESMLRALDAWREEHADLEIIIVRGNHDRHAGDPPARFRARVVDEPFAFAPFSLVHHPTAEPHHAELAGHVHPCIRLREANGGSGLRAACFLFGERQALLPAFGGFTGTHPCQPKTGDRVFAIGPDRVLEVTGAVSGPPVRQTGR